jgi:methylenetetrahydrofolate dehydrogenase (NADP+)/methenyltetrahydrofolate cyclohydrolase
MTAKIIDGKAFAAGLREKVARQVTELRQSHGLTPGLAVVLVGENPASQVYVRNKAKQTRETGMESFEHRLSVNTTQEELLGLVARLNEDPAVHGILVQLPLPEQIDDQAVLATIDPAKDVDGFHVINAGRLMTGARGADAPLVACTPLGCLMLLRDHLGDLTGLEAVIVGRSNIVGKPMGQLLLGENCTVRLDQAGRHGHRCRDQPHRGHGAGR